MHPNLKALEFAIPEVESQISRDPGTRETAQGIFSILIPYLNLLVESSSDVADWNRLLQNQAYHLGKIADLVALDKPIHFVLPAFPAKSPNRTKTQGALPDMGEVMALMNLERICKEIARIYRPGAFVTICSDGRVFSEIVGVADNTITAYQQEIVRIIEYFDLQCLSVFTLEDCFSGVTHGKARAELMQCFASSLETVQQRVKNQKNDAVLFNGMHRFLFEDGLYRFPKLSRNQIRKRTKIDTYELIRASEAWGLLVEKNFPGAVRLSIHPQLPAAKKLGVQLVKAVGQWRTPWHSVCLFDGIDYCLLPRTEAESLSTELKMYQGRWSFYSLI